jgi:hypothetical protein
VILHINYTALYDGALEEKAKTALQEKLPDAGAILFSPKQDFPDAWNQMDAAAINNNTMPFAIKMEHLPFFLRGNDELLIKDASILLTVKKQENVNYTNTSINIIKGIDPINMPLSSKEGGDIIVFTSSVKETGIPVLGNDWTLTINGIAPGDIENIVIGFSFGTENN